MVAARAAAAPSAPHTDGARRDPRHGGGRQAPKVPARLDAATSAQANVASRYGAPINAPDGAPSVSSVGGPLGDLAPCGGASGHAPGGPGGDGSLDEPGSEVQIMVTAIGNQERWIFSQGRLEQQGCRFRNS